MKRKIIAVITCTLLLTTFIISYASSENGNWASIGNENYSMLPINSENPLLTKHLQDHDYIQIENALVDKSVAPMSAESLAIFEADPDAVMVDNMLPNGEYLKANWAELRADLVDGKMESKFLKEEGKVNAKEFNATIKSIKGKEIVKMKLVESDGSTFVIPNNPDELSSQFIITPDGKNSFLASDLGIWLITDRGSKKISSDTYDSKSYEELSEQSIKFYDENIVKWNDNIMPNPGSSKLAYISNKHNIDNGHNALFVYDLETSNENLIVESDNANYMDVGWLDDNNVLCLKLDKGNMEYVVVGLDGNEVPLSLNGDKPFVYAVQNNLIAYAESLGSEYIHIAKYTGTSSLEGLQDVEMGWQTRIRVGNHGFSPDNSKFACLYIPKENQDTRYVEIVDFKNNSLINIDSLPGSSDYILEFSWIDDNTLLVVTDRNTKGITEESTWTYTINGGEK